MDRPLLSVTDQLDQVEQNNRILTIDDDQPVLDYYQEVFEGSSTHKEMWSEIAAVIGGEDSGQQEEQECYQIDIALSGEEGVRLAQQALSEQSPYSIALVDMRMPGGMDGLETAQKLRELDDRIMLVIVTAYSDYEVEEIHRRLLHDVLFLNKPLSSDEIKQTVRMLNQNWRDREKSKVLELQMVSHAKMAALGNMAVRIGHEINQPLSYINGMLQLQKMELESGKALDVAQVAEEFDLALQQTVRIKEIIDSLRVFAHPDKHKRGAVSLPEAVDHVCRIFRGRLESKCITFTQKLEQGLPNLFANTSQLQRILTNLTSNAIDALIEQRQLQDHEWIAEIVLQARYLPDQEVIEILFSDNGTGVPEKLQGRMFDPFVTTKEPGKGTGLGLSEIHGMLKEHGASIEYCPDPNWQGARFVILFPIDEEKSDE